MNSKNKVYEKKFNVLLINLKLWSVSGLVSSIFLLVLGAVLVTVAIASNDSVDTTALYIVGVLSFASSIVKATSLLWIIFEIFALEKNINYNDKILALAVVNVLFGFGIFFGSLLSIVWLKYAKLKDSILNEKKEKNE